MALNQPMKIYLKSTTSQTLNDRFTEMMRTKVHRPSPPRANLALQARASAKNRRLAEQMSRRSGAVMDSFEDDEEGSNVRKRLDRSRMNRGSVKDRLSLGKRPMNGHSYSNIKNRLGSPPKEGGRRGRGSFRSGNRGGRGGRGRGFGGNFNSRGRGTRGRGRGRGRGFGRSSRNNFD